MSIVDDLPGGPMERRQSHFIWLLDCSGSMGVNGKIGQLNFAIREAVPEMRRAAEANPAAELRVRAITFASGAAWHIEEPVPVEDFAWEDVTTYGVTDMGAAFRLAAEALQTPPMPERSLPPALALISDGAPTDDWRAGLRAIQDTPWGKRAVRVAIAIGNDADKSMLKEFLVNPELEPLQANNPRQLAAAIRWASTVAVKQQSQAMAPEDAMPTAVVQTPPPADDDGKIVW